MASVTSKSPSKPVQALVYMQIAEAYIVLQILARRTLFVKRRIEKALEALEKKF